MKNKSTFDLLLKTVMLLATAFIDIIMATVAIYGAFSFPLFLISVVLNILTGIIIGWNF